MASWCGQEFGNTDPQTLVSQVYTERGSDLSELNLLPAMGFWSDSEQTGESGNEAKSPLGVQGT